MEYLMEKGLCIGKKVINKKVNGKMMKKMEKEFIIIMKNHLKGIGMKVIIEMVKWK